MWADRMASPLGRWGMAQLSVLLVGLPFPAGLKQRCWRWVKWELCYLAGRCIHQGICCRFLSIHIDSNRISTSDEFQKLIKERPVMKRFVPHMDDERIEYFTCRSRKGGKCHDYETRPAICREYPHSVFFLTSALHVGCGYVIRMRDIPFLYIPRWVKTSMEYQQMVSGARGV